MSTSTLSHHWAKCSCKAFSVSLLVGVALVVALSTAQNFYYPINGAGDLPSLPRKQIPADTRYGSPRQSGREYPAFCDRFDVSKVAISIKTGATEGRNKIPTQLMTFLRCIADVMLFSDLTQRLGSHTELDVIASFPESSFQANPDFDLYLKQKEYAEQGRETELRKLGKVPITVENWRTPNKNAAWGLDRYKFLHMIQQAWDSQPNKDWYVFIEADTYLSISNLLRFLGTQDPKQQLYFGNGVRMWEHPTPLSFAHGGSGFILSGATMKAFAEAQESITRKFIPSRISQWWYGDFVVADALDEELGVHVTDITPMVNSEEPALLPFDRRVWCKPIITLHHMDARQFDDMYNFQKARNFSELLFRDVYSATYGNGLPLMGELWDNLSDDRRYALETRPNDLTRIEGASEDERLRDPNYSFAACKAACVQNGHCFQFSYIIRMKQRDGGALEAEPECHLSKVFLFGREVRPDEHAPGTEWTSGWLTDRIRKFIDDNRDCPDVDFGVG